VIPLSNASRGHAGRMQLRRAEPDDLGRLAQFAAALQHRPDRHICYLDVDASAIAEELAEADDWAAVSAVATSGSDLVGWLVGSVDVEIGRVWWYGPFVEVPMLDDWIDVVDALYQFCARLLPPQVTDEEMAPDRRFANLIRWATALGFRREFASAVLEVDVSDWPDPDVSSPDAPLVRALDPDDRTALGLMHDTMFPGTHSTTDGLLGASDDDHIRLGLERNGRLVGYIAAERQPGGDGYIDFVGVDPEFRGRGDGERLVRAAIDALRDAGCTRICLTVREDNHPARGLYDRLGFDEERVIVALRRSLPGR